MMAGCAPRLPQLRPNQVIHERFVVEKKLGEGGFGAVYKLSELSGDPPRQFAIKLESVDAKVQILKMEVFVLEQLQNLISSKQSQSHFCRVEAKGRTETYNYMVMTLVGPSLYYLKKKVPALRFTLSTALRSGVQCLEAIRDLHTIGYLHRDLKPANYCVGNRYDDQHRVVFMLDFGMCRKYKHKDGRVKTPRRTAGFRGTTRYASLNCHMGWELARKDDLEMWFYQQIELTKPHLPWRTVTDKDEVRIYKEQCRNMPARSNFLKGCPAQYDQMLSYIDSLKYWDAPDYEHLFEIMATAINERGYKEEDLYDWEMPVDELPQPSQEDTTQAPDTRPPALPSAPEPPPPVATRKIAKLRKKKDSKRRK